MASRKRGTKQAKKGKSLAKSGRDKGSTSAANALARRAVAAGSAVAKAALAARAEQQALRARRHAAVLRMQRRARPARASAAVAPRIPVKTTRILGPKPTSGLLIAEGDSWFDYPGLDILSWLEDEYLFDVESVAHKGDCVEDMAHTRGQFEDFARRLEKRLRQNEVPRAILLSGGGNDIAGEEFRLLLNHAASSLPALNEDVVRGIVDVRLRAAYLSMITGLTAISKSYLNRPIPIVVHGYDYAVPDGRGFLGGFFFLPGPWLEPGFHQKGWADLEANKKVIVQLINRFNNMLKGVGAHPQFKHVHYLNLRNCLRSGPSYRDDWANELHPSRSGFKLVTKKFADLIMRL